MEPRYMVDTQEKTLTAEGTATRKVSNEKKKTETLYIGASRTRSESLVYDYRTNGKCKTIYQ